MPFPQPHFSVSVHQAHPRPPPSLPLSRSIRRIIGIGILISAVVGIVYGVLRADWPGAFALSSLIVTCFALLLGFFSASDYLGLDRIVDDQIDMESGKLIERESSAITEILKQSLPHPPSPEWNGKNGGAGRARGLGGGKRAADMRTSLVEVDERVDE